MADARSCDTGGCTRTDAHRVEAAAAIYELIEGSSATGHAEGADACPDHYATTLHALLDFSVAAILQDAPALAESLKHAGTRDAAIAELDGMRSVLAAAAAQPGGVPKELRERYDDLVGRATSAETARIVALREQTKVADMRTSKLAKALKQKR